MKKIFQFIILFNISLSFGQNIDYIKDSDSLFIFKQNVEIKNDSTFVSVTLYNISGENLFFSDKKNKSNFTDKKVIGINLSYIQEISDPLSIPKWKLPFKKVKPNESFQINKSLKNIDVKELRFQIDFVVIENITKKRIKRNLKNGFIQVRDLFFGGFTYNYSKVILIE